MLAIGKNLSCSLAASLSPPVIYEYVTMSGCCYVTTK
jgi:hypothetical protein